MKVRFFYPGTQVKGLDSELQVETEVDVGRDLQTRGNKVEGVSDYGVAWGPEARGLVLEGWGCGGSNVPGGGTKGKKKKKMEGRLMNGVE